MKQSMVSPCAPFIIGHTMADWSPLTVLSESIIERHWKKSCAKPDWTVDLPNSERAYSRRLKCRLTGMIALQQNSLIWLINFADGTYETAYTIFIRIERASDAGPHRAKNERLLH